MVAGALLSVSATAVELTVKPNRPGIYVIEPGPWHAKIAPGALATLPGLLDEVQIKHLQGFSSASAIWMMRCSERYPPMASGRCRCWQIARNFWPGPGHS